MLHQDQERKIILCL